MRRSNEIKETPPKEHFSGVSFANMDRWYLCKHFFSFLEENDFDWVTKAKRNTALFRKVIEPGTRRERYEPLTPVMLSSRN
ncbi:hypothetical protein ACF3MZ_23935 [Paenibacillaceae bacterium WGS1546]|uniref:hypothetical protein n=1 Tax=Cohnella sp. WGS1546 TaxID=3366810 RepID=UPI00372D5B8F